MCLYGTSVWYINTVFWWTLNGSIMRANKVETHHRSKSSECVLFPTGGHTSQRKSLNRQKHATNIRRNGKTDYIWMKNHLQMTIPHTWSILRMMVPNFLGKTKLLIKDLLFSGCSNSQYWISNMSPKQPKMLDLVSVSTQVYVNTTSFISTKTGPCYCPI